MVVHSLPLQSNTFPSQKSQWIDFIGQEVLSWICKGSPNFTCQPKLFGNIILAVLIGLNTNIFFVACQVYHKSVSIVSFAMYLPGFL
jgi:hypothetical protein